MKRKTTEGVLKKGFGYTARSTDEYVKRQKEYAESRMEEQRARIESLVDELGKKQQTIDSYREREQSVQDVLIVAAEKADEIETELKLQYAMEIERLKLFQAKWTEAYDVLKQRYGFEKDALNMEAVITQTSLELERKLNKDFGIKLTPGAGGPESQFKEESKRLQTDEDELHSLIKTLKNNLESKAAQESEAEPVAELENALKGL